MTGVFPRSSRWRHFSRCAVIVLAMMLLRARATAQEETKPAATDAPIRISADISHQWRSADGMLTSIMRGNCRIEQGETAITAGQMVVWHSRANGRQRIEVFLERDVLVTRPGSTRSHASRFLALVAKGGVTYKARWPREYEEPVSDPLLERASAQRRRSSRSLIRQTQLIELPPPGFEYRSFRLEDSGGPLRRIRLFARTGQPYSFKSEKSTQTTPAEQIVILTGGIKLNVDTPRPDGLPDPQAIELAADNVVIWTEATDFSELTSGLEKVQTQDAPLQIYLEGNIVIRQQGQTLKASRAFYDARDQRALLIDAELELFIPQAQSHMRVRANRIRQLNEGAFHARGAWLSASYFGKPQYRLEATDIFLEPRVVNPWVHAQGGVVDPATGEVDDGTVNWLTTLNNSFVIGDTPVAYFPYLSGPVDDPQLPIQRLTIKSDSVFGTQIKTAWNPFQLFARDSPEWLSSSLLLDGYSERGVGAGLEGSYERDNLLGVGDRASGIFHGYYVHDDGRDNLGEGRNSVEPSDENRGVILNRHRHELPYNLTLFNETGFVSDRNFLEQWYETEFDQGKDYETRLSLEQKFNSIGGSLLLQPQLNDFENVTEWYPRGDVYALAEPVPYTPLTWTMHTSAGYAELNAADDISGDRLPHFQDLNGEVVMTRNELTMPFNAGPAIVSPFVMGEAAQWGEALNGESLDRLVGSAGVRGSLTMSKVFPYVQNRIFNLNGLAHRMVFDFEYSYTDSTENIDRIAQFNTLDDNAQERFRQRFIAREFGGTLPDILNERRFAIRSGAGSLVTAPWHELVDDLHVLRGGWHHRLQTKVGPPGQRRIRDWMTLDLGVAWFPRPESHHLSGRDFAEDFGLYSMNYSWLLSERTTLLANGLYDTFDGGQEIWNVGVLSQRTARGSIYAGVRQVKAQGVDSQIATASVSYLFSEKWAGTASTAYDLAEGMNRGQSLSLTRIGADFLFHFGFNFDRSKDSVGVAIALEPRFGPRSPYSAQMDNLLSAQ